MVSWGPLAGGGMRALLRSISDHTGLPATLVAAIALALSWRLFKRTLSFAFEVALALVLLAVANRLGWIRW
jgi:hypothetical protein